MNKVYFTKVFKGYSPEEVEAFIIKLNSDMQQKQQEFAAETKKLSGEIAELKKRFEDTIAENENLAKANRALTEEKQSLLTELKELSEAKTPAAPIQTEARPVARETGSGEDYKKLCEQMGERILVADMRAEEIIKEAKYQAEALLAKARADADGEIQRLVTEAKRRVDSAYRAVEELEKKQIFIAAGLEQARKHISDILAEAESLASAVK